MLKKIKISVIACLLLVASCGGGGSDETANIPTSSNNQMTQPDVNNDGNEDNSDNDDSGEDDDTDSDTQPETVTSVLTQEDVSLGACVNMANQLEAPNEGDWGRPINNTDFADIAAQGFETIRLPVRFSNHALTEAPFTIDAEFMQRIVDVVDMANAANLRVILDIHHYNDPQGNIYLNPEQQTPRFVALWGQIAEQFASYDNDLLWFELLNEPVRNLNHTNLLDVLNPALAEVRLTNPTRPVIIGGENASNVRTLSSLPLPNDGYIIATFHYYDPFGFTHQGATFLDPVPPIGVTFTEENRAQLNRDVQAVTDFMERTGVPIFLGEYGAFDVIPLEQRAEYYDAVVDAFGSISVDACAWGYTNTFQLRDSQTNEWFDELLNAVGL